jgi:protocatechuate 3,4-dioxygenase beta subunit
LDDGESDEQGKVTFRDMKPGLYKIKVHGHRIEKAE